MNISKVVLVICLLAASAANATTYTWDGGAGTWEGQNWNGGNYANESDSNPPSATSYDYINDDFIIGAGGNVTSSERVTLTGSSINVTGSTLSISSTSNLPALVLGHSAGSATSSSFINSTVTLTGNGSAGRTLHMKNDANLDINNTTLNIAGGSNPWIEVDDGVLTIIDSNITASVIKLDGAVSNGSWIEFVSGNITLSNSNAVRGTNFGNSKCQITGGVGDVLVVQTNNSSSGKELAEKVKKGFFWIDDTRIQTSTSYNGSNIATVNSELAAQVVGGRFFQMSDAGSGGEQTLYLVAATKAFGPSPANGAVDVNPNGKVSYSSDGAASYDVYVAQQGNSLVLVGNYTAESVSMYELATALSLGILDSNTTYEWRVDTKNGGGGLLDTGDVWSFTVMDYYNASSFVIEDFFVYDNNTALLAVWDDGSSNSTGSVIDVPGLELPTDDANATGFIRPLGIMELGYDNSSSPYKSEADLLFENPGKWLLLNKNVLSLKCRAGAGNSSTELYVEVTDGNNTAKIINPLSNATTREQWKYWNIRFSDLQQQGVDLNNVTAITIGVGDGVTSSSGLMYIDDIELRNQAKLPEYQPLGDVDDDYKVNSFDLAELAAEWLLEDFNVIAESPNDLYLRAYYKFNEVNGVNVADSSGNGYDATVNTSSNWQGGGIGSSNCLLVDGSTEVNIPAGVMTGISDELTISFWINGKAADSPNMVDQVDFADGNSADHTKLWNRLQWDIDDANDYDGWNHYAVVKNVNSGEMMIYHNGITVARDTNMISLIVGADSNATLLVSDTNDSDIQIDELKIYSAALSQAQVVNVMGGSGYEIIQPINPLYTDADIDESGSVNLFDLALIGLDWITE